MESKGPSKRGGGAKKKKSKGAAGLHMEPVAHIGIEVPPEPKIVAAKVAERRGAKKKSSKRTPAAVEALAPSDQMNRVRRPVSNTIVAAVPFVHDDGHAEIVDDEDDGYGDDTFENYSEDEFEAEDVAQPSKARTTIAGVKRADASSDDPMATADLREVQRAMREENAAALERRRQGAESPLPRLDAKKEKAKAKRATIEDFPER
jgi:hypothetical protein